MQSTQKSKDQKTAECRIWVHWLLWTICPFGGLISCSNTGNWKPFQVAFIIAFGVITLGITATKTEEDRDMVSSLGGGIISITGGVLTQNGIQEARKRTGINLG